MLSQTGVYALQALLHLAARRAGERVPAGVIARELGVPAKYLAKVLQRLAREGVLESTRGAQGGYRLAVEPASLTVAAAVMPFEDVRAPETCLLGGTCDPSAPCSAHARRSAWGSAARGLLEETTLADLLPGAPAGPPRSFAHPPSEDPR